MHYPSRPSVLYCAKLLHQKTSTSLSSTKPKPRSFNVLHQGDAYSGLIRLITGLSSDALVTVKCKLSLSFLLLLHQLYNYSFVVPFLIATKHGLDSFIEQKFPEFIFTNTGHEFRDSYRVTLIKHIWYNGNDYIPINFYKDIWYIYHFLNIF